MKLLGEATVPTGVGGPNPRLPSHKEGHAYECLFVPLLAIAEGDYVIEIHLDEQTPTTLACSVHQIET